MMPCILVDGGRGSTDFWMHPSSGHREGRTAVNRLIKLSGVVRDVELLDRPSYCYLHVPLRLKRSGNYTYHNRVCMYVYVMLVTLTINVDCFLKQS